MRPRLRFLLALCLGWVAASSGEVLYSVADLGTLGGSSTFGAAIKDLGQVTGSSFTSYGIQEAFLYNNGQIIDLGTLGIGANLRFASTGNGINDLGDVVGTSAPPFARSNQYHAVLYRDGQVIDLGTFGHLGSVGSDINNTGQVSGDYSGRVAHAFLHSEGQFTDLGTLGGEFSFSSDVNNSGQAVGTSTLSTTDLVQHAFLYTNGEMIEIGTLGGTDSFGLGINDTGQVVGYSTTITGSTHAFLYSDGGITDLSTLPGRSDSYALNINERGQVVGYSSGPSFDQPRRAFLYGNGQMSDLNDLIGPGLGITLSEAAAINNKGQIVGNGTGAQGYHAFLLIPVPEPNTLASCGLGLLGLALPARLVLRK